MALYKERAYDMGAILARSNDIETMQLGFVALHN